MPDYTEPEPLDDGLTWTAAFRGHDWARRGSFFYLITLRRHDEVVKRFPVELDDYAYGDPTCRYTEAEVERMVHAALASLARGGEANTDALV